MKIDEKKKRRKQAAEKERKRVFLKKRRNVSERKNVVKEGPTYESQYELNTNTGNVSS